MLMENEPNAQPALAKLGAPRILKSFMRDEEGGIIIFALLVLMTMLLVGGMAVDFMRYETQRVKLQSVTDRAVLSAADLNQTLDTEDLVKDFFKTAGFEDNIVGTPVIVDTGNSRSVTVTSEVDLNTIYLRLAGIDQLTAPARATAIEGIGKVEISLVLDISGSMRNGGTGGKSRFQLMQEAAVSFSNKVLDPSNGGQVSLTIVPYAGSTNPGADMFAYLGGNRFHNFSSCMEMESSDWNSTGMPGANRAQVPHFMYWAIAASVMDWGWCPQDNSAIRYAMSSASEAETFINGMRMHDGTGTHYAMKYGLAALDPNTQPAFAYLNTLTAGVDEFGVAIPMVADKFANRPAAWDDPETRKIIVLMTDGGITTQSRPINPVDPDNYVNHLASNERVALTSQGTNVTNFEKMCDDATDLVRDVEVFTVAFEVSGGGYNQMRDCASEPSMFYPTSGTGLIEVFDEIADQINNLRLNL